MPVPINCRERSDASPVIPLLGRRRPAGRLVRRHRRRPRLAIGADFVVSRTDGTVWAWVRGNVGELGNGGRTSSSTPVRLPGLSGIVDVVAVNGLSAALRADGAVWGWGSGAFGVFGSAQDGSTIRATTPAQIPELQDIKSLAIVRNGPSFLAVDDAGRVFQWGTNRGGQAGTGVAGGTAEVRPVPQAIGDLASIGAIAAGDDTLMAASRAGAVFGWGSNR